MKIIFKKEHEIASQQYAHYYNGVYKDITTVGNVILEQPPQKRTILTNPYSNPKRLNFPYVQFSISYAVVGGRYFYLGMDGATLCGLKVSFSSKPIFSFKSKVFNSILESPGAYFVCTPHYEHKDFLYDGKSFNTLEELYQEVISTYWFLNHSDYKINFSFDEWSTFSQEDILNYKFKIKNHFKYHKFIDFLNRGLSRFSTKIEEQDKIFKTKKEKI